MAPSAPIPRALARPQLRARQQRSCQQRGLRAYAEEVATLHAEALGFGRAWTVAQGMGWVVSRDEISYRRPAAYGDELELTTTLISIRGARAVCQTSIRLVDGPVVEVTTEWVWVRAHDGRPMRLPAALIDLFAASAS